MSKNFIRNLGALFLAAVFAFTPLSGMKVFGQEAGEKVTRGEFSVLVNSFFLFQNSAKENFLDVPDNHPYAGHLLIAKEAGYMRGDGSGNIYPDAYLTGAEAAVAITNFLGLDVNKTPLNKNISVPDWAKPAASVLLDFGMVDINLIQKSTLTYADVMTFLTAASTASMFPDSPYALTQADLKDDFFAYTNRKYLATKSILPGYIYAFAFLDTSMAVQKQQQDILSGILNAESLTQSSDEWKIKELYMMYLDNPARTASISKIKPYFDEINAAGSIDELLGLAKKYVNYFNYQSLYTLNVNSDAKNDATKWAAFLMSSPLDLGSRDYYADEDIYRTIQQAYRSYIVKILQYMGETEDLEARATALFEIEKTRAALTLPTEQLMNPGTLYTEYDWDYILKATGTTNTLTYSEEMLNALLNMNIYCPNIGYIEYVESLYADEANLRVLKDYALLNAFSSVSGMLGDDLSELSNDLMKTMYGSVPEKMPLENRAQSFVSNMMSGAFSNMYAKSYGSAQVKNDVTNIIESIRDKYRERIMELTWMSEETKLAAVEKLDAIKAFVAYPDKPTEKISYEVTAKDAGGCLIDLYFSMCEESYKKILDLINKPVEINLWDSIPTSTVNAFYSATENAIIIPAGILQEPFYDPNASREENLGAIGAIIAHEFTHAFDNTGAQYDKNGTLTDWWTEADYTAFSTLAYNVASELSTITFAAGANVNGFLCTGETIADLGAVSCVLDIAKETPGVDLVKVMESWANVWAARMSSEVAMYMLYNDTHLPHKLRVNFVLAQMEDFYEVFGITENDGMYIPVEERINIW